MFLLSLVVQGCGKYTISTPRHTMSLSALSMLFDLSPQMGASRMLRTASREKTL